MRTRSGILLPKIYRTSFGFGVGIAARLLLPGHGSIGLPAAIGLSFLGALGGEVAAERLLPADAAQRAGFLVSAIGALAVLLVYGIAAQGRMR